MLTDAQLIRYNRQLLLHDFDIEGQEKLAAASVLVVGLGGLGCPAALYLAAAGVGRLVLADGDEVEPGNLQRQIAHSENDLGVNKAVSAAESITALNPEVDVRVIEKYLQGEDVTQRVAEVDLVVDASDNYTIRFELNRACIAARVPLVSAAAVRTEAQISVFDPANGGPCYRCLYEEGASDTALSCSESGVLAPIVGVVGSLQATEALKVIAGLGEPLRGRLLMMDSRSMELQTLVLSRRENCPDCKHL